MTATYVMRRKASDLCSTRATLIVLYAPLYPKLIEGLGYPHGPVMDCTGTVWTASGHLPFQHCIPVWTVGYSGGSRQNDADLATEPSSGNRGYKT